MPGFDDLAKVTSDCRPTRVSPSLAECISCGLCESVCPPDAIYSEEYLPQEENQYIRINAEFFGETVTNWGSPGGAAEKFRTEKDHPLVAAKSSN